MMIKKLWYIILLLTLTHKVSAQVTDPICFQNEWSIDSINLVLKENSFPFQLSYKFTEPTDTTAGVQELLIYYGNNKKDLIHKTYRELEEITTIMHKNEKFYMLLFYDEVGYDFFLIVQENPFVVFESESYNFDLEPYHIITESFDFENKSIKIFFSDSKIEKTVNFKPNTFNSMDLD